MTEMRHIAVREIFMTGRMLVTTLIIMMAVVSGCAYVPLHVSEQTKISKRATNFLEPGKTTRAEVLLQFGDPSSRFEKDCFFLYVWELHGYFLLVIPWLDANVQYVEHYNSICLEFTPDNLLRRFKFFTHPFKDSTQKMFKWMDDKPMLPKNSKS